MLQPRTAVLFTLNFDGKDKAVIREDTHEQMGDPVVTMFGCGL